MYLYANFNTTLYAETRINATLDDGKNIFGPHLGL